MSFALGLKARSVENNPLSTEEMEIMDVFGKLRNMKTLLIDDDELIRTSLGMVFEIKGCYLVAIETAEEGLRTLKEQGFDIIICDYRLPGIDGLEFFKFASGSHANTVNILITAYSDNEMASKALMAGVHDIIDKPFSPKAIMESLSRLL